MIPRVIVIALLSIASCGLAHGQTTSSDAKDGSASATPSKSAAKGAHHARKAMHHGSDATMHHRHDAGMRDHDRAYRGALKHCVEGPQDQRESCLDRAIAQYGR